MLSTTVSAAFQDASLLTAVGYIDIPRAQDDDLEKMEIFESGAIHDID